ncbi:uncharacterized protein [Antedon mediterranea]|uniref:uncharacterized protein n=1 Tax=Antedon mediterranea TaxID=105859 RepID=UPI003AF92253
MACRTQATLWMYCLIGVLAVCIVVLEAYPPQPIRTARNAPEYSENLDEIYNFINYYKDMLDLQEAYRNNDVEEVNPKHMALKRGSNSRPVGTLGLLELLRLEMEEENTREVVSNQRLKMEGVGR